MTFDWLTFFEASVSGIPLTLIVLLTVEAIKQGGVQGKALYYFSLGVGLFFGICYQISVSGLPLTFADGFAYFVYGLGLGFFASRTYDFIQTTLNRAAEKAVYRN